MTGRQTDGVKDGAGSRWEGKRRQLLTEVESVFSNRSCGICTCVLLPQRRATVWEPQTKHTHMHKHTHQSKSWPHITLWCETNTSPDDAAWCGTFDSVWISSGERPPWVPRHLITAATASGSGQTPKSHTEVAQPAGRRSVYHINNVWVQKLPLGGAQDNCDFWSGLFPHYSFVKFEIKRF